jgi:hypothetical protein
MKNDYVATKKSYKKLHTKLDNLSNTNVYAFLGLDPDDISNEKVYMYDLLKKDTLRL